MSSSTTSSGEIEDRWFFEWVQDCELFSYDEYFSSGYHCNCGKKPKLCIKDEGVYEGRYFWICGNEEYNCGYDVWQDEWMSTRMVQIVKEIHGMKKILAKITKAVDSDASGERLERRMVEEMENMRATLKWVFSGFVCLLMMGLLYVRIMK